MTYLILKIHISNKYKVKLQLHKANSFDIEAPILDLGLSITNDIVSSIYNKRDDFNFEIVKFPFRDRDVPCYPSFGVYILNKSENATLELFAIYIQNDSSQ